MRCGALVGEEKGQGCSGPWAEAEVGRRGCGGLWRRCEGKPWKQVGLRAGSGVSSLQGEVKGRGGVLWLPRGCTVWPNHQPWPASRDGSVAAVWGQGVAAGSSFAFAIIHALHPPWAKMLPAGFFLARSRVVRRIGPVSESAHLGSTPPALIIGLKTPGTWERSPR